MKPQILIVNAVESEAVNISKMLEPAGYPLQILGCLDPMEAVLSTREVMAVLFDLDSMQTSNREMRKLTLKFPGVCFLCTSWKPFHPELRDAICYHIYACVQKPIDPDELLYWMKSIAAQSRDERSTPLPGQGPADMPQIDKRKGPLNAT